IYDVADVDDSLSGAAVDWRMDVAVTELDLGCIDRCAIYLHRLIGTVHCGARGFGVRFERVVVSAELFVLLASDNALLDECSITFDLCAAPVLARNLTCKVRFRLFLGGGVFREIGLRLFQVGVERPRIDREKQIALANVCAVSEMNLLDTAGDLWLNRHRFTRDDLSE